MSDEITDRDYQTINVYNKYKKIFSHGRIVWSDEFYEGAWVVSGYNDVKQILKDKRFSVRRTGRWIMGVADENNLQRSEFVRVQSIIAKSIVFIEGEEHIRLRKVMNSTFTPRMLEALRPEIKSICEEILEGIDSIDGEEFEFINEYAKKLPSRVMFKLLGITILPPEDFDEWTKSIAIFLSEKKPKLVTLKKASISIARMIKFIDRLIDNDREIEESGLLRKLCTEYSEGDRGDIYAQILTLLFAGYETTRHILGTSLYWLLKNEDVYNLIKKDPGLIKHAAKELLRFDSPIQYTARRATTEIEIFDTKIKKGDLVVALIGAANRDPEIYPNPELIDLTRGNLLPLSFGVGLHMCIGTYVTLTELEESINLIIEKWPNLSLSARPQQWLEMPLYRGLEKFWVKKNPCKEVICK